MVLVDSNVILDVLTEDPRWLSWSGDALSACADDGLLAINPIVFAEVSIRFETLEALPETAFRRLPLPWEAAFLAGKCFLAYRRRKGARTAPLPDFLHRRACRRRRADAADARCSPLPHVLPQARVDRSLSASARARAAAVSTSTRLTGRAEPDRRGQRQGQRGWSVGGLLETLAATRPACTAGSPTRLEYHPGMRPLDTSEDAHLAQLEAYRRMSPAARLRVAFELSALGRQLLKDGIRHRHPEYAEDEVEMATRRVWLGPELFHEAYPEAPELSP